MEWDTISHWYQLSDGGYVHVTDDTIVPMGDAHAYRQLTYTNTAPLIISVGAGLDAWPTLPVTCEIVFEVRDGVPGCVCIKLSADERFIRAKDLSVIKLDELREEAYALAGVLTQTPDGKLVRKYTPATYQANRKRIERATSRRKVTPEFLRRVAELHNGTPEGGRLEAVKAAFSVSERQALRYIAQARREGLINE